MHQPLFLVFTQGESCDSKRFLVPGLLEQSQMVDCSGGICRICRRPRWRKPRPLGRHWAVDHRQGNWGGAGRLDWAPLVELGLPKVGASFVFVGYEAN